ncbi:nitrate ABC transporter permease [Alcanivorax sp. N3-2A]|nr:nitrate ABC transporter permease [Alcanivorax sp. N3-2A]
MKSPVRLLSALLGLVALGAIWEGLSRSGVMSPMVIPPLSAVPEAFLREWQSGIWLDKVLASLRHYLIGLLIGSVLGVLAGIVVASMPRVEAAQAGLVRVLRPIPPLAWIPFAIIWFGVTETAATFIIAIGIFWINYYTSLGAVQSVDKGLLELADAFGHTGTTRQMFKVSLPAASPGILGGLRAGIGQGWMTVVAAELFGIPGIGQRMMDASGLLATDVVVVYMLTISALYALTDTLFVLVRNRILGPVHTHFDGRVAAPKRARQGARREV